MHLCPLARRGLGSDLMAACPGFEAVELSLNDGPGAGLGGRTCGHIGSERTARGFAATCLHPEAHLVVGAARIAATALSRPT